MEVKVQVAKGLHLLNKHKFKCCQFKQRKGTLYLRSSRMFVMSSWREGTIRLYILYSLPNRGICTMRQDGTYGKKIFLNCVKRNSQEFICGGNCFNAHQMYALYTLNITMYIFHFISDTFISCPHQSIHCNNIVQKTFNNLY